MSDKNIDEFKNLQLKDKYDINILLLGEKGVGKSTLINALVNYLTYMNFEAAQKKKLILLANSEFVLEDTSRKKHKIVVGSGIKNENLDGIQSETSSITTYVFPIGHNEANIRLIDTPGMGDMRGIDHDDKNCENILNYISNLHELHAVCLLFKLADTRIDVQIKYYMKQLFSRLDKSASRNIIFVFTNSKSSNISSDALNRLRNNVEEMRQNSNIEIPLDKNIFCFDNEALTYMAALRNNVENVVLSEDRAKQSWNQSRIQSWR